MAIYEFEPVLQERIWGGRMLESRLGRKLPEEVKIGESWEITDRPEAQTIFPALGGRTLHDLWIGGDRAAFFGTKAPQVERFPILIKLLDAREKLSLQVHPPARLAAKFSGEPKTEMWFFIETDPGAEIFVGLRRGVNREKFEQALKQGRVAECFHRLPTARGEAMFLPSGRVHAIGGGNVILEVQQNSDTTFRVYDWDRVDSKTGKPRDLHVAESLECINWSDFEPVMVQPHGDRVVNCDHFAVWRMRLFKDEIRDVVTDGKSFRYLFVARGRFRIEGVERGLGAAWWMTADHGLLEVEALEEDSELVSATFPE